MSYLHAMGIAACIVGFVGGLGGAIISLHCQGKAVLPDLVLAFLSLSTLIWMAG